MFHAFHRQRSKPPYMLTRDAGARARQAAPARHGPLWPAGSARAALRAVRCDQLGEAGKAEIIVRPGRRRRGAPALAALAPVDPGRMKAAPVGRHMVVKKALGDVQDLVRAMPGLAQPV